MRRFFLALCVIVSVSGVLVGQSTPPDCAETSGATTRYDYTSSVLGQRMYYTVYTPPCYDAAAPAYPVMYLMHGSNENDEHWLRLGLADELDSAISAGELPPVVAVLPFGNVIANRNRFDALSWANIFRDELVPHAQNTLNIATDGAQRAIGGVSRGGFWAYQIALRDPQAYTAVGGHSAFFDLYHAPDEFNPLDLAFNAPEVATLRLWLDRGADDFAAPGLDIMHERLTERGVPHTYNVYPEGQHENGYWSSHLREYLDFYTSAWQTNSIDSPAPAQQAGAFVTNTPAAAPPVATLAPPTLTPTPVPVQNTAATQDALAVFFPAVAFPSLQTSLSREQLGAVANGTLDEKLVLTPEVQAVLQAAGIAVHPQTRLVERSELRSTLWRDRSLYTLLPIDAFTPQLRILWVDDVPVPQQLESYPFAVSSDAPNFDPAKLTRLTFSGVTALARNTRVALSENSVEWATEAIAPYVTGVDVFHTSNEVSLVDGCPQAGGRDLLGGNNSFCMLPDHAALFTQLDVDVVELTGNHNNDYGYDPYANTLGFFEANDIATVGGGRSIETARQPLLLSQNDSEIALVACNAVGPYYALVNEDENALGGLRPGAAACDWTWLEETLPALAADVDVLVVTVQHREFEEYLPSDEQRRDFQRLANLGADVVMGTAAHKPQTYEFFNTRNGETAFIHYGMGNLFFDQPFWGNRRFFMNTLYIYDGQLQTVEFFPGIIDDLARPRLMTPDERINFLFFMLVEQNGF